MQSALASATNSVQKVETSTYAWYLSPASVSDEIIMKIASSLAEYVVLHCTPFYLLDACCDREGRVPTVQYGMMGIIASDPDRRTAYHKSLPARIHNFYKLRANSCKQIFFRDYESPQNFNCHKIDIVLSYSNTPIINLSV